MNTMYCKPSILDASKNIFILLLKHTIRSIIKEIMLVAEKSKTQVINYY